jgi:hypothetical protein
MIIQDNLNLATITLADFASDAPIGTALATVDIVSSVIIPQATKGRLLSLPNPTDTKP